MCKCTWQIVGRAATRCEPYFHSTELGGKRKDERRSAASHGTHTATAISCVQEDFY